MTTNGVQYPGAIPLERAVPFKRDVARRIDRVIDYFGAAAKRDHPRIRGRRTPHRGAAASRVAPLTTPGRGSDVSVSLVTDRRERP